MKVNFELTENYALNFEGRHIDLHNNFEFQGFEYNIVDKEVKLKWKKSTGEWVPDNELLGLVLIHRGVTFFNVISQDENSIYDDDDGILGIITFFPSTLREMNDSFVQQAKPIEGDDIIYQFENGQIIRIHCEQISFI